MTDYVDAGLKTRLVLPFAISAPDRIKDFTKDMEMAAVFYQAESNREKSEGHILKKTDEKLVFLTEACYPIWLVPWSGGSMLFDGLGVTSHTLSYDKVPDITAFNKDVQGSAKTCKAYSVALTRNVNYFKNFVGKEEKNIEGLIASPDFKQDFLDYLSQMKGTGKPTTTKVVLSPLINESEISASVKELSDLRAKIDEDVENLNASMKLLNKTTMEKVEVLRKEIKETRKKFAKRIKKVKPRVTRKRRQIQEKYDKKITRASKRFERRLRRLHEDQAKLEKTQRHLAVEIKRCKVKIKSCRRRKNKRNESQWTRKLKRIRKRLPALKRKIGDTAKKIEKLETAKKLETAQQRIQCETRIERATKTLRDLEASREARIKIKRQEITALQNTSSSIIDQMNEMAKSKKASSRAQFDSISIARRKKANALVYLPFYLARYEMEPKKRYVLYPPSIVGDLGILTKMKGALGVTKMKAFLQPRSKAMTVFLNQLVTLIQKNSMFEKEVTEAGIQDSVLRMKKLRRGVKKGLRELEDEKWISNNEFQTLSKLLYIYA